MDMLLIFIYWWVEFSKEKPRITASIQEGLEQLLWASSTLYLTSNCGFSQPQFALPSFSLALRHIIWTRHFFNQNGKTRNFIYKFGSRLSSPGKSAIQPRLLIYFIVVLTFRSLFYREVRTKQNKQKHPMSLFESQSAGDELGWSFQLSMVKNQLFILKKYIMWAN